MIIFGCIITIAVYSGLPGDDKSLVKGTQQQLRRMYITLAALFLVLIVGGSVVGSNTSLACPDWPLCNASLGVLLAPPADVSPLIWFHLIHRYSVFLFTLWLGWVVYITLKEQGHLRPIRLSTIWLAGLFLLQAAVGATQVLLQKPAWLRATHVAVATAVWAVLVILALFMYFGVPKSEPAA